MLHRSARHRFKPMLMACAVGVAVAASAQAAGAQDNGPTVVDPGLLVEQLVAEGVISREQADRMIRNATVPAQTRSAQTTAAPVPAGGVAADGAQIIPYVPQVVRDQIVQQVRAELGGQAQAEGWSRPGETPEWTRRIELYGDVRVRSEGRYYEDPIYNGALWVGGNYPDFLDWSAINAGAGYQINKNAPGFVNPPYLNTVEDRQRLQLRARLGLRAQITDWISADVRLATGADGSPVSTNQTLGGEGGGNYEVWLDRASIRLTPVEGLNIDFGRFGNPFWTSDLVFDNDLNFDGAAVSGTSMLSDRFSVFGAAGAFPVYNTDLNFGSRNAPQLGGGAFASQDKYLLAAHAGFEVRAAENLTARIATGYFHYDGVQGEFSSPCRWDQDVCDTDATRPAFQQFGNTMTPIRNISPNPAVAPGTSPELQYFGLASEFELVNFRGQVEYRLSDGLGVRLDGDFVRNLAFDYAAVAPLAQNNFAPAIGAGGGGFDGGDTGWQTRLTVGDLDLGLADGGWAAKRGDWSAHIAYRHLESDAVIDGFADSDFGLGGTNAKGWIAGAYYGVAPNALIGARWMSTDEVAGPPLSIDRLFIDLNTRF